MSLSLSTNARHRPPDTLPAVVVNTLRCRHPAKDLAPTVPPEPVVAPPSGPRTPTTSAAPPAAAVRRPTVKPLATGDAARDRRRSAGDGRLMLVVPVDRFRMRSPADEQARWCANAWHEIYQGARGDESVQESDGASGKASPVFPHVGHMTKPRRHLNLPPWRLPRYRGCSASSSRRAGDRLARPARGMAVLAVVRPGRAACQTERPEQRVERRAHLHGVGAWFARLAEEEASRLIPYERVQWPSGWPILRCFARQGRWCGFTGSSRFRRFMASRSRATVVAWRAPTRYHIRTSSGRARYSDLGRARG